MFGKDILAALLSLFIGATLAFKRPYVAHTNFMSRMKDANIDDLDSNCETVVTTTDNTSWNEGWTCFTFECDTCEDICEAADVEDGGDSGTDYSNRQNYRDDDYWTCDEELTNIYMDPNERNVTYCYDCSICQDVCMAIDDNYSNYEIPDSLWSPVFRFASQVYDQMRGMFAAKEANTSSTSASSSVALPAVLLGMAVAAIALLAWVRRSPRYEAVPDDVPEI